MFRVHFFFRLETSILGGESEPVVCQSTLGRTGMGPRRVKWIIRDGRQFLFIRQNAGIKSLSISKKLPLVNIFKKTNGILNIITVVEKKKYIYIF